MEILSLTLTAYGFYFFFLSQVHKEIQLFRKCCLLSLLELAFCPQETPKTEHAGIKEME